MLKDSINVKKNNSLSNFIELDKSFIKATRLAKFKPPTPMINPKYRIAAIVKPPLNHGSNRENWGIQVGAY